MFIKTNGSNWYDEIITSRTFGEFLCKLPYSDAELARKIGANTNYTTIYRWRTGQNVPSIEVIIDLALALNIAPSDAQILIRKARHAFGDDKQDYELLKKLHREPIDRATAERRQRGNAQLAEINCELSELAGQLHALNRLNAKGIMDAALFVEKSNALNKKLTAARQTKVKLLSEDTQDDKAQSVANLLETLKSDVSDTELFIEIVDRITVNTDDTLTFKLKCGLELTETFERTVRYGLAAQNTVRLYGC